MPLLLTAFADPPAPPVPVMHVQASVVQVDVVVTDSKGKPVMGLSQQDFTLLDNGKARAIDIFSLSNGETVAAPTPPAALQRNVFSNRNAPPMIAPNRATIIVLDTSPAKPAAQLGRIPGCARAGHRARIENEAR